MINSSHSFTGSKRVLFFLALIAVVLSLSQAMRPFKAQDLHRYASGEQAIKPRLKVAVQGQTDAPIGIRVSSVDEGAAGSPQIAFMITNIGDKPIRAYTIRYEARIGSSSSAGMMLTNINVPASILIPGESNSESLSSLPSSTTPISRVELMVDYVEFLDGTSWGPDVQRSAELLAGQRAGARAEAAYLLRLLDSRGPSAIIDSYKADEPDIIAPSGYSEKWVQGFQSGRDTIRANLRNGKRGSMDEIKSELQRSFDLSERR